MRKNGREIKDPIYNSPIEGTKFVPINVPKDHIDNLNVKDINDYMGFVTKRTVNPLEPTYIVRDDLG